MFRKIEGRLEEILGIEHIDRGEERRQKERFLGLARNAFQKIILVAGELNPNFYDGESGFPKIIKDKIERNDNFRVEIMFHKKDENATSALDTISIENPELNEVFRQYPNNIRMYWAEKRPKYHFCVFDNNLFLEDVHETGIARKIAVVYNQPDKVNKYEEHLEKMKTYQQNNTPVVHLLNETLTA